MEGPSPQDPTTPCISMQSVSLELGDCMIWKCQFYELRFDGWDATAASIFQGQSGFAAASNASGGLSLSSVPVRMIVWRTLETNPMLRIYKFILVWHWAHFFTFSWVVLKFRTDITGLYINNTSIQYCINYLYISYMIWLRNLIPIPVFLWCYVATSQVLTAALAAKSLVRSTAIRC